MKVEDATDASDDASASSSTMDGIWTPPSNIDGNGFGVDRPLLHHLSLQELQLREAAAGIHRQHFENDRFIIFGSACAQLLQQQQRLEQQYQLVEQQLIDLGVPGNAPLEPLHNPPHPLHLPAPLIPCFMRMIWPPPPPPMILFCPLPPFLCWRM